MKNIHILKTDKPSRLGKFIDTNKLFLRSSTDIPRGLSVSIYIISDEKPKKGDWCLHQVQHEYSLKQADEDNALLHYKVILSTDQDLIKDGVQAIDDEFLEWFVKNPSCEEVVIEREKAIGYAQGRQKTFYGKYKIIIPKEETKQREMFLMNNTTVIDTRKPKQETLEEAAERMVREHTDFEVEGWSEYQNGRFNGIIEGAKWQQERSFSEEDIKEAFFSGCQSESQIKPRIKCWEEWFEQFKKK